MITFEVNGQKVFFDEEEFELRRSWLDYRDYTMRLTFLGYKIIDAESIAQQKYPQFKLA